MYRITLRCLRHGKPEYLYITTIVDEEDRICSYAITYNKYKSHNYNTLYEAMGAVNYIRWHRKELLPKIRKDLDEDIEDITGFEIDEDYGTQRIVRLVKVGKF